MLDVYPNTKYVFYYHWIGPPAMTKAYNEGITMEIPELKLKKRVRFSVGVDLMVESIRMKYGSQIFPVIFEPITVSIRDRFHPKADLVKIFKAFGITIDLKINQAAHIGIPPEPFQQGILSALMTAWEGSAVYPHVDPIMYDGPLWGISKTSEGKYVIRSEDKGGDRRAFVQYPGVIVFERGTYQFEITISPGPFDADPRNNKALTDIIEIKDFPSQGEEVVHTVLLPSIQFLVLAAGDLPGVTMGEKADAVLTGINLGLTREDIGDAVRHGDLKRVFLDTFSLFLGGIDNSALTEMGQRLLKMNTLALYAESLVERIVSLKPAKKAAARWRAPVAYPRRTQRGGKKFPEDDVFALFNPLLRRAGSSLVVIQRDGIDSFGTKTSRGSRLDKGYPKNNRDMSRRPFMFKGKRYIVIPMGGDERMDLSLSGTGEAGRLTVITPHRIAHWRYPASRWEVTLVIDPSGQITTSKRRASASVTPDRFSAWADSVGDGQALMNLEALPRTAVSQ